jgi:hypothetical protein
VLEVRQVAETIITVDPELRAPDFERLRAMVLRRYGERLALAEVG